MRRLLLFLGLFVLFGFLGFELSDIARGQDALPSFTDVPETREDFSAIENLRSRGIVEGRPDGSFGPDDLVNRAEAVTIVVRAVANVRNLPPLANCFPDVHGKDWYVRPVCYAKDLEWIGGYPDGTFQPIRTVSKIEFLKILLIAYGTDVEAVGEWEGGLAPDASDPEQWYVPYLAYAVGNAMTSPDASGNLHPASPLTRGNVALLMDRFLLTREGQRNDSLIGDAFKSTQRALDMLVAGDLKQAGFASLRSGLLAKTAEERLPEESLTQATVGISEALRSLVRSHEMLEEEKPAEALRLAQEAYGMADTAAAISTEVQTFADRIRTMAHDLAEEIRSAKSRGV